MIKWKRPSGRIIETNDSDAIIEYAAENGWELVKEEEPKPEQKPKPKKKAIPKAVENDNSVADSGRVSGRDRR